MGILVPLIVFIGIIVGIWFFYITKFRTKVATPNQALLVTGRSLGTPESDPTVVKNEKGNYVKIVRGGVVRLKFQQYAEKINLNSFQLSISVQNLMVKGKDVIDAEAKVQISVGDSNEHVLNYAEQFLGKSDNQIQSEIEEIITTHFRAILTTLSVEEINSNREEFNNKVTEIAKADLDGLGFKISSFGLGNLVDSDKEGGYLSNSERQRKATMRKEAEIVESEAERETRIRKAEDEKIAKELENERAIEIAKSNKLREIEEANIKMETDKAKAEAETVYELEKATQSKKIVSEQNEVDKIKREGERKIAMIIAEEQKEVALKQAEQKVEEEQKVQEQLQVKAKSQSEIEKIQAQTKADVELTKAQTDAKVELEIAQAENEKKRLEVEIEAERLERTGKATAESILAQGKAKAESEKLLAEAKLVAQDIHLKELAIKTSPEIAKAIATAIGSIDSVKVFNTGGEGDATGGVTKSLASNVGLTYEMLKDLTGIDMSEIALNNSKKHHVNITNQEVVRDVVIEAPKSDVKDEVETVVETVVEKAEPTSEQIELDLD